MNGPTIHVLDVRRGINGKWISFDKHRFLMPSDKIDYCEQIISNYRGLEKLASELEPLTKEEEQEQAGWPHDPDKLLEIMKADIIGTFLKIEYLFKLKRQNNE